MKFAWKLSPVMYTLAALLLICFAPLPVWSGRITAEVLKKINSSSPSSRHSVIIRVIDGYDADRFNLRGMAKAYRNRTVVKELQRVAEKTQKSVIKTLTLNKARGRADRIRTLWIVNSIAVEASADLVQELAAAHPDIEILPDREITLEGTYDAGQNMPPAWNLDRIKAQKAWELGYRGKGVVVATLDTGVDSEHPDLKTRYRGGQNSWYDPATGSDKPSELTAGLYAAHGTQVMGVLVGGDASGTPIGVAPEASYIAARIFYFENNSTKADESDIIDGFQWVLDPDGDPFTDDSPNIVNNSWDAGRIGSDSCTGEMGLLHQAIQVVRAAGILPVFAAGNRKEPVVPAAYAESVAVGGTDINNYVWDESVSGDGSGRGTTGCTGRSSYPDIVAPAVSILTTDWSFAGLIQDTSAIYRTVTGTSVASPHIAGTAAILLSANPFLTIEELQDTIEKSAVKLGDVNIYGNGLIDAEASLNYMLHNYPPSPVDVQVKNTGPGEITVSWTPPVPTQALKPEDAVSYKISRNGAVIADNYGSLKFTDMISDDSASYTYTITTVISGTSGKSANALLGNINDENEITRNRVDAFDLASMINAFGKHGKADLNGDNIINDADLAILLKHFGQAIK